MSDFGHRLVDHILNSAYVPVRVRMAAMRALGYRIDPNTSIWQGACFMSKRFTTGPGVFINVGFFFDGHDQLRIGRNVRIGQFVRVLTATHDIGPHEQRGRTEVVGKPVTIEDGCWIGANVTILPGVTVRSGCVIAAGSVVTKDTLADGLYAGVPARLVRMLPGGAPPAPARPPRVQAMDA